MVLCDISLLGRCWGTSRFTNVQPIFLDVDVYKWMLSSIPIEVEVEEDQWSCKRSPETRDINKLTCLTRLLIYMYNMK